LRLYLDASYPAALRAEFPCAFEVLSLGQLTSYEDPTESNVAVTLFLYRVTVNEQARNRWQPGRQPKEFPPALPLDLHWMVTVWASGSTAEHVVFGWALSQLERLGSLDTSRLTPDGGWHPSDVVQVLPAELPLENLMRVWDAIQPSYRLSTTYVTRVVRLDLDAEVVKPAVAIRHEVSDTLAPDEAGP
jgi:hypothetical protein